VSARDAWAVGWSSTSTPYPDGISPDVLHWNGATWSRATVAGIPGQVMLQSVVAPGPGQVWISGEAVQPFDGGVNGVGLLAYGVVYRLDGSRWTSVPLVQADARQQRVNPASLYSGPGGQVWMTGTADFGRTVIALWTGTGWRVTYAAPANADWVLQSLDIVNARDGWAAGYSQAGLERFPHAQTAIQSPLLLHWNGTTWQRFTAPSVPAGHPGGGSLSFIAATATSPGLWATGTLWTGQAPPGFGVQGWLSHWNGTSWATVTVPDAVAAIPEGVVAGAYGDYSGGGISAGPSGWPQWIIATPEGDASRYLYYTATGWVSAPGVTTPGQSAAGMRVVAIPGTNATWAIGSSLVDGTSTGRPRVEYTSG
jgi:hypothetical protein